VIELRHAALAGDHRPEERARSIGADAMAAGKVVDDPLPFDGELEHVAKPSAEVTLRSRTLFGAGAPREQAQYAANRQRADGMRVEHRRTGCSDAW
jgi:hypothetical protein